MRTNGEKRAFTLIELLVVITIIVVLVSIAFPVYNSVIEKARRTQALSMINQVKTALISYQNEYNDWPPSFVADVDPSADGRIDADTRDTPPDPGKWNGVYKTLTATGDEEFLRINNKRRLTFMEFPVKVLDNKTDPSQATTFLDPWGHEYCIVIDSNGDNLITKLPNRATGDYDGRIGASVAIWSYGPDRHNLRNYVVSW